MLTALQFFAVIIVSGFGQLSWPSAATGWRNWVPSLPERRTPFIVYVFLSLVFGFQSIINNLVFAYEISVPLQTVFRSSSLPVSLVIGYLFFGERYSFAQSASCVAVAVGVIIVTLADAAQAATAKAAAVAVAAAGTGAAALAAAASASTSAALGAPMPSCPGCVAPSLVAAADSAGASAASFSSVYLTGIALLCVSLLLSGLLGHIQQHFSQRHRPAAAESLFYSHLVYAPAFLLLAAPIATHAARWVAAHVAFATANTAGGPAAAAAAAATTGMFPVTVSVALPVAASSAYGAGGACGALLAPFTAAAAATVAPVAAATVDTAASTGHSLGASAVAAVTESVCGAVLTVAGAVGSAAPLAATAAAQAAGAAVRALAPVLPVTMTVSSTAVAAAASSASTLRVTLAATPVLALLCNVVSQFLCVSGVYALTACSSATATTMAITVRKFVSIVLSVLLFDSSFTTTHWLGTCCVFFGAAVYVLPARTRAPAAATDAAAAAAAAATGPDGTASAGKSKGAARSPAAGMIRAKIEALTAAGALASQTVHQGAALHT
jgi:drug/metabolite transporter (DMT)-like permease